MNTLTKLLNNCRPSPERPHFHPERTLGNHIALVALKCMIATNDVSVVWAALLHDIHKPTTGEMVSTDLGDFWSNPDHPKMAAAEIESNDDIRFAIWQTGGNWELVRDICLRHMACKEHIPKKDRDIPMIDKFVACDDMINRHPFPTTVRDVVLPDGGVWRNRKVTFVGQSPIQRHVGADEFTITLGRTPLTFKFSEIPDFFVGKFEFFNSLLKLLV